MNEVFTRFVCVLRQKVSMKHHVSSIEALHRLHPKSGDQGEKVCGYKKCEEKVSCACFSCQMPVERRGRS